MEFVMKKDRVGEFAYEFGFMKMDGVKYAFS